ncbi:MAG: hypothetical protein MI922_10940, partial [Bacteroidales bacterium]|nr:hypothetical protein [Bacteroidales bacterium]
MKLEKVLDQLNSFEKNSFLKIISSIIEKSPNKSNEIDKIIINDKDLKNEDNINIVKVFNELEDEFMDYVKNELLEASSQFDILIDILIRDGNCIMSREWFNELYNREVKSITKKVKEFQGELKSDKSEISERRKRDYQIYKECLYTAFYNDLQHGREPQVTADEQSILNTLGKVLGLSHEEIKLINYIIIELKVIDVDSIIEDLRNLGVVFYSKRSLKMYVPDEIVRILRKVRGKEVADKYFRRVLKQLKEPQINLICKNHNIARKNTVEVKIESIIKEGISFSDVLKDNIFKEGTGLNERKAFINDFVERNLMLEQLKGVTLDDKVNNLIGYFEQIEKEEKVGISVDGYDKLLVDLSYNVKDLKVLIKKEFQLQEDDVLKSDYLLDFNIKPRDILDLLS